jgi:hypothetical protein
MARHLSDSHLRILAFVAVCKGFSFATENVMPYARHRPCDGVRDDAFLDKNIAYLAYKRKSLNNQLIDYQYYLYENNTYSNCRNS